jgi:hypothetical protein
MAMPGKLLADVFDVASAQTGIGQTLRGSILGSFYALCEVNGVKADARVPDFDSEQVGRFLTTHRLYMETPGVADFAACCLALTAERQQRRPNWREEIEATILDDVSVRKACVTAVEMELRAFLARAGLDVADELIVVRVERMDRAAAEHLAALARDALFPGGKRPLPAAAVKELVLDMRAEARPLHLVMVDAATLDAYFQACLQALLFRWSVATVQPELDRLKHPRPVLSSGFEDGAGCWPVLGKIIYAKTAKEPNDD